MRESQKNLEDFSSRNKSGKEKFSKITTTRLKEELMESLKDLPVHKGAKESFQERFELPFC